MTSPEEGSEFAIVTGLPRWKLQHGLHLISRLLFARRVASRCFIFSTFLIRRKKNRAFFYFFDFRFIPLVQFELVRFLFLFHRASSFDELGEK